MNTSYMIWFLINTRLINTMFSIIWQKNEIKTSPLLDNCMRPCPYDWAYTYVCIFNSRIIFALKLVSEAAGGGITSLKTIVHTR